MMSFFVTVIENLNWLLQNSATKTKTTTKKHFPQTNNFQQ